MWGENCKLRRKYAENSEIEGNQCYQCELSMVGKLLPVLQLFDERVILR